MLEWDVVNEEDGSLPDEPESRDPRRLKFPGQPWQWLLGLITLTILGGSLFVWQARRREAQLRQDLSVHLEQEARAQLFGVVEQIEILVDPSAPRTWRQRYVALFTTLRPQAASAPALQTFTPRGDRFIVEVSWPDAPNPFTEERAYRLVTNTWRRTPLPVDALEPLSEEQRSTYFALIAGESDFAALTQDPELRLNLEGLRGRVITYWPDTWAEYFLTVSIQPQELSPPVYFADAQKILANSPDMALADPYSPLPIKAQYRLALITSVVQWLTTPAEMRELLLQTGAGAISPTLSPPLQDRVALIVMLQQAEARRWALDGAQRQALRNAWRAELDGKWHSPFDGPLPISPPPDTGEERLRWITMNLLIERQIEAGGPGVPGRMARTIQEYPANEWTLDRFFSALIGGSREDVETLGRPYVLTPEP